MACELRLWLPLCFFPATSDVPQLDDWISRASDDPIVVEHGTHVDDLRMAFDRLEMVQVDRLFLNIRL